MALESTATYIDSLVISNPEASDDRNTADDHLRLIKGALRRTFPNISGEMSVSYQVLNTMLDRRADRAVSASYSFLNSTAFGGLFALGRTIHGDSLSSVGSNDYSTSGIDFCTVLRLPAAAANRDLTGLVGGTAGRVIVIQNTGSITYNITIEDTDSAAANRFLYDSSYFNGGIGSLWPGEGRMFVYDVDSSRWRALFLA